jgi:hypothetical protein
LIRFAEKTAPGSEICFVVRAGCSNSKNIFLKLEIVYISLSQEDLPSSSFGDGLEQNVPCTPSVLYKYFSMTESGKLNIPVNLYVVPNSEGLRFGASFGFNSKNK